MKYWYTITGVSSYSSITNTLLQSKKHHALLLRICTILSLLVMARLLLFALEFVFSPIPQEFRESALLSTTSLILQGENPFALRFMPAYTNVYGVVYNLLTWPLASVVGNTYPVHRIISALFASASLVAVYAGLRKKGVNQSLSLIAVVMFFISIVTQSLDLLTRPDSMALFFFLLSILIPDLNNYSRRSLFASVTMGLLAFATKPYLFLGSCYVLLYVFFFHARKKGLLLGIGTAAAFLGLVFMHYLFFPAYLITVIFNHLLVDGQQVSWPHLYHQLTQFFARSSGLVLTALLISWYSILRQKLRPTVYDVAVTASLLLVIFKFGHNEGNSMTYLAHLLTPALILMVFPRLKSLSRLHFGTALILLSLNVLSWTILVMTRLPAIPRETADWRKLVDLTITNNRVFNSPLNAHILLAHNRTVVDNGQSGYFVKGLPLNRTIALVNGAEQQYVSSYLEIRQNIAKKEYDVVFTSPHNFFYFSEQYLALFYNWEESLYLPTLYHGGWQIDVWRPKPGK